MYNIFIRLSGDAMERRRAERYAIDVDADIIFNGNIYNGTIENFSHSGLGLKSAFNERLNMVDTGSKIDVKFNIFHQNEVNFPCEVRWKRKYDDPEHGSILRMGMEYLEIRNKQKQKRNYLRFNAI